MRHYRLGWMLLAAFLIGCNSPDFEMMAQKRLEYARQNQGDIHIVVFKDQDNSIQINGTSTYLNGIKLAVEEINQRPGKLIGRSLKIEVRQDGSSFEDTKQQLRSVANDPKVTAVLGHAGSSIAVPASVVYERSQIMFLPPFSTAQGLTSHNFQYVFRMMPNARVMAEQLVSVAGILGYKKIVILYSRDDLNRELAFLFEDAAIQSGIKLVQNSSFFEKESNYRPLISQFNSKPFDAVFIAAGPDAAGTLVKQLREMGIDKPILGNEEVNIPTYVETAGAAAENTIAPVAFRPSKNPTAANFVRRYQRKYDVEPDIDAAQGYDSIMLLATVIQNAGSTIPPLLSSTLHYLPAWVGVTGLYAYTDSGELRSKKYVFNVWQSGAWHVLPAIQVPYLLGRFEQDLQKRSSASASQPPSFLKILSQRLSPDDLKMTLLELAQAILKFNSIGIIYEDTENGRQASGYNLLKQVAGRRGFKLIECAIPFSKLDQKTIEREVVTCLGKLSISANTQYISYYGGISEHLINQLSRILPLFKCSTVSVEGRKTNTNMTLVLDKRNDVDPLGLGDMQVYRSLLKDINVQELAERLHNLPNIAVNLEDLKKLGIPEDAILLLSPGNFMGVGAEPGTLAPAL